MCTVNVLLSTYNGEKYIKGLIDSVLAQKGVDVILSIRDDGSTDRTIPIIRSYHDKRIKLFRGKNLKSAKSFLKLLREAREADYYAYCDQDDVWEKYKLAHAVEKLKEYEKEPALYMSTYNVVDENLNFMYKRDMWFDTPLRLETTILFRAPSACTMVFNQKLRNIIKLSNPKHVRMHDFWTLLVALGIKAKIVTEDISLMKYRIHGDNTVGLETGAIMRLKRLLHSVFYNKNERMLQAKCLYDNYSDLFDEDVKQILLEVICYRDSLGNRLKFLKNKQFRWDWYINTMFKISVLMGVF